MNKLKISSSELLFILAALSAFTPFSTDMYLSAFELIADHFNAEMGSVTASLSIFFFGLAAGQIFYGPLIDRYGRKPLLMIGVFVYAISSLLVLVAPSIEVFNILRLMQAIGSCAGMVVARAVIGDLLKGREASHFFSSVMIVGVIAPIIGPTLGGYMISYAGWESVFIFLGVFSSFCLLLVYLRLPETLDKNSRTRHTFKEILTTYMKLFVRRHYILPTLVSAISFGQLFAFITGSPHAYMVVHAVAQKQYGLLFGLNALGMIVASKANQIALKHFEPIEVLWGSVCINLICALFLFCFGPDASLPVLVFLLFITLVNVPVIAANAMALSMEGGIMAYPFPREK